jgi:hypothetical protein
MPPKKVTIKPAPAGDISVLFKKASAAPAAAAKPVASESPSPLTSTDPEVQAFYDSLTPYERVAHTLATTGLGTSYDVRRTHGFLRWQKTRK